MRMQSSFRISEINFPSIVLKKAILNFKCPWQGLFVMLLLFVQDVSFAQCTSAIAPQFIEPYVQVCEGETVTVSVDSGDLNDAVDWYWYVGSCAETLVYVGASYTFDVFGGQYYYVRGEGGCTTPGPCTAVGIYSGGLSTIYADTDGDGFGDPNNSIESCDSYTDGYTFNNMDCDDSDSAISPYGNEICNGVDDDCDGLIDEICPPVPANDDKINAFTIPIPFNNYPGCILYEGTVEGATVDVPNFYTTTGEEVWYKFYSNTRGVRIQLIDPEFNGMIDLYDENGGLYETEDIMSLGETEIMNYVGLDTAAWYYVAIRNFNSIESVGTFSLCLQRLNRSFCASPGNKELCANFKPQWTGANQYVTTYYELPSYNTTQSSASGQSPLSDPDLDLRYNTSYLTIVDAVYDLLDGDGNEEQIIVNGTRQLAININGQPDVSVKESQRCEATLLRGTILQYKPYICVAIDFHIRFTRVDNSNQPLALPFTVVRGAALTTLPLGFTYPEQLMAGARYLVEVKPIFSWGEGTFGTPQCIKIIGAAMNGVQELQAEIDESYRASNTDVSSIYPNPNLGDMLNINIAESEATNTEVRVFDSFGKLVFNKSYSMDGSLNAILTFDQPLSVGLYTIEFKMNDGSISSERMLVTK